MGKKKTDIVERNSLKRMLQRSQKNKKSRAVTKIANSEDKAKEEIPKQNLERNLIKKKR